MLTNFGKALRKMRIDHSEFLKDMAVKLGVTVAYLSAVENGKREVPDEWLEKLTNEYNLTSNERKELQEYAYENKESLKINLSGIQREEKELALAFARSFKDLSDEDMRTIQQIFNKR